MSDMNFLSRFSGKTSTLTKGGIGESIAKSMVPVDKLPILERLYLEEKKKMEEEQETLRSNSKESASVLRSPKQAEKKKKSLMHGPYKGFKPRNGLGMIKTKKEEKMDQKLPKINSTPQLVLVISREDLEF